MLNPCPRHGLCVLALLCGCVSPRSAPREPLSLPGVDPFGESWELTADANVLVELAALQLSCPGPESLVVGAASPRSLARLATVAPATTLTESVFAIGRTGQEWSFCVTESLASHTRSDMCLSFGGYNCGAVYLYIDTRLDGSASLRLSGGGACGKDWLLEESVPWPVRELMLIACALPPHPETLEPRSLVLLLRMLPSPE